MKRNYWPLFFIAIFGFTFYMIVWTIYSAVKVPVQEDDAFFKKYQDVDENYNEIINSNNKFLSKYDFKIILNNKEFDLDTNDIFLSQRVIEKRQTHRDILKVGENSIEVAIKDKTGNSIENMKIKFRVTKATNNNSIIDLPEDSFIFNKDVYNSKVTVPSIGNWNIIATFEKDDSKGYLFIKTNAN